jgi:hypothetical protein
MPPRGRVCADEVLEKMPFSVGRIYVEKRFNEESKQAVSYLKKAKNHKI